MEQLSGIKSQAAQAGAGVGKVKSAAGRIQEGSAAWDKRVVWHLALYMLLGIVIGCGVFVPHFGQSGFPVARSVFFGSAVACLLLGLLHHAWVAKWSGSNRAFGMELLATMATMIVTGVGICLIHFSIPRLLPDLAGGASVFALVMAGTALALPIPFLFRWCFEAAFEFEGKRYRLWYYPQVIPDIVQDGWHPDRIVLANLHLKRKEHEELAATMNVKLPQDAKLGEVIYLFIEEHNRVKNPNNPIQGLWREDGSLGWLFHTKSYLFPKQRTMVLSKRYLDPDRTIGENHLRKNADIFFERITEIPTA